MKIDFPKVNDKMWYLDHNGKPCPCTVTETWGADQYHVAGFRVHIVEKYGHIPYDPEFKDYHVGHSIFWSKEDANELARL